MNCDRVRGRREFREQPGVVEFARELAIELFTDETGTATRDVDEFADEVVTLVRSLR